MPKKQIRKNKGWDNLIPAQKGEVRNPSGRPQGTRNKFSETFLKDFLSEWEEGGIEALREVRTKDPSTFLRVAASILPKEFNVNEGETALERLLEQYGDKELDELIAGLCALGANGEGKEDKAKKGASKRSGSVH